MSLAGNVALVTGGASGIGLETALTFADLGASPIADGITGTSLAVDAGIGATWDYYETPPWLASQSMS